MKNDEKSLEDGKKTCHFVTLNLCWVQVVGIIQALTD